MNKWLDSFAFHVEYRMVGVIAACAIVLILTLSCTAFRLFSAAVANTVNAIQSDH